MRYIQSIDPQDRNPTSTRGRNHLGRAGRAGSGGLCRGTPAPRRNLCAGDEHKPKESTFKKKTLWSLHTLPYLALNDGILSPVHGLQADTAQCRFGRGRRGWRWQCSGTEGGGSFITVVRAGQGVKIVPYDGGVGLSHLQNLFLCINEHEVQVL